MKTGVRSKKKDRVEEERKTLEDMAGSLIEFFEFSLRLVGDMVAGDKAYMDMIMIEGGINDREQTVSR
ncbi:MAG: hypothetical protein JRI71_10020 [Deltaproteobacteria bacterium]|nr:hypothetical protein [Deltaproteobacteria bacterium]MBW2077864.1 hypothetical protein [Deltaproteobacteria bacterium]